MVDVLHELEKDRINHTNEFVILKGALLHTSNNTQQPNHPPSPTSPSPKITLASQTIVSDEDDFLSYLKRPLTTRFLAKVLLGKKSVKFTRFYGIQDPRMHVHKFQEEAIEYMNDRDLLAKLFSYSFKDEAIKWYLQLLESIIDRYEDLIRLFLHICGYNIIEKVYLKDLCKIKQLPNQSMKNFVKIWKK